MKATTCTHPSICRIDIPREADERGIASEEADAGGSHPREFVDDTTV